MTEELTFPVFLELCKEANVIAKLLKHGPSKLHGKRPSTIRAATVWLLAKERKIPLRWHHMFAIFGVYQKNLVLIRKIIVEEIRELNRNEN